MLLFISNINWSCPSESLLSYSLTTMALCSRLLHTIWYFKYRYQKGSKYYTREIQWERKTLIFSLYLLTLIQLDVLGNQLNALHLIVLLSDEHTLRVLETYWWGILLNLRQMKQQRTGNKLHSEEHSKEMSGHALEKMRNTIFWLENYTGKKTTRET